MKEQVQCECGEAEMVQIGTEQAYASKCSSCWEEYEIEEARREAQQMKIWERENRQQELEYRRSRL